MEEGSLLQEALRQQQRQQQQHRPDVDDGDDEDDDLLAIHKNALLLDVHLLMSSCATSSSRPTAAHHWQKLAQLGVELNAALQQEQAAASCYPWMTGGDGPVFGVHGGSDDDDNHSNSSSSIPHLRAVCRYYGVGVDDEWRAVGAVMDFLKTRRQHDNDVVVECWDVDDGQLLLIEAAEHLPSWVDEIGPQHCRHRCWIARGGQVVLIRPSSDNDNGNVPSPALSLSLQEALTILQDDHDSNHNHPLVETASAAVQKAIRDRIDRVAALTTTNNNPPCRHRAAVAVPRSVAHLFRERPDLVATACRLFVEQATTTQKTTTDTKTTTTTTTPESSSSSFLAGTCEDWVWTTLALGRTDYAMLRTVTASPAWRTEDAIPDNIQGPEINRLKRLCAVEATPHLRHGFQLGVRLVAGLEYGLTRRQRSSLKQQVSLPPQFSSLPPRLLYWSRLVARECGDDWMARAWHAGPEAAAHDLTYLLRCPVFVPEVRDSLTPLSHPETDLSAQIQSALRRRRGNSEAAEDWFDSVPPRPDEVDSEAWMWMTDDENLEQEFLRRSGGGTAAAATVGTTQKPSDGNHDPSAAALDEMLTGVRSFLAGQSSVEGVATTTTRATSDNETKIEQHNINPTVFLNVLHATLQAKSAQELTARLQAAADDAQNNLPEEQNDPFFSKEDYDLMMGSGEDDEEEHESEEEGESLDENEEDDDVNMVDLMNAMDDELQASTSARQLDRDNVDEEDDDGAANRNIAFTGEAVAQDVHVLSNLLKSLDASAGGPGPIRNMLSEMGIRPPDVLPSSAEDDHEDENFSSEGG